MLISLESQDSSSFVSLFTILLSCNYIVILAKNLISYTQNENFWFQFIQ